jgi:carbonic anhydrase/acetyltransferase-like protein (isoleucine patch superfamily)
MVPDREDLTAIHEAHPQAQPLYSSQLPILGNEVLRAWMKLVRKLGVQKLWLTSTPPTGRGTWFALSDFARRGVDRVLIIKLKSYAEINLAEFMRFHCESENQVTEAQDRGGLLGVSLLNRAALLRGYDPESGDANAVNPYPFRGYAKRIQSARERQELVADALTGACSMRPCGKQIREDVWAGEGFQLAASAKIVGPSYIGERTIIRAGATIGPFASVERDCLIHCGTTVEGSTVLPFSYLAPGLLIRQKLVDGRYLVDLVGGKAGEEVVDLQPARLGRKIPLDQSSHREAQKARTDAFQPAGSPTWNFAPFSTALQPWLQFQM